MTAEHGGSIVSMLTENRVFPPPPEFSRKSHISSLAQYEELWNRAKDDPEGFWGEMAQTLRWSMFSGSPGLRKHELVPSDSHGLPYACCCVDDAFAAAFLLCVQCLLVRVKCSVWLRSGFFLPGGFLHVQ